MTTYTPHEAVVAMERGLRQLLEVVYTADASLGPGWHQTMTTKQIDGRASKARERYVLRSISQGMEPGFTSVLDFVELSALVEFLRNRWDLLEDVLGPEPEMGPLLDRAVAWRHDAMHGRALPASARDMLSGIAVEIQNRIGRFMNERDAAGLFYPALTAAGDSTNRQASAEQIAQNPAVIVFSTPRLVRVGDSVELSATASDPQGRDLEWIASPSYGSFDFCEPGVSPGVLRTPSGVGVVYPFGFVDGLRSRNATIHLYGRAVGSDHYQEAGLAHDVRVSFAFHVLPGEAPRPAGH
ncbi:hypothetical protein [Cellulomonas massiliensis]|uniref:hypothetical protein n=1 Tax=Cellulomonas massiliensis TaxID=1465811 RepID=UPI0003820E39|nr:hypothetical protein [Cellulomonas massiliensis]